MDFLFDECLHTSLVQLAAELGHNGQHVNWLGLSGTTDHGLMPVIRDGAYTFVTNNAADFRKLYAKEEVHMGLVIIVPNVRAERQRELFAAFCAEYAEVELVNTAVEIRLEDDGILFRTYALPVGEDQPHPEN